MSKPLSREKRSEYLQTTFTPTERRLIEQAARSEDRTVSALLRLAALSYIGTKGEGQ
jgi:hypothetical protein